MSLVTLEEFQLKRAVLSQQPLKGYESLLLGVGNYYQETRGSEIDGLYVLETEHFLNEVYLKAVSESTSYDIQEIIIQALGLASALSYATKQDNFDNVFFIRAKQLGNTLINISISISIM